MTEHTPYPPCWCTVCLVRPHVGLDSDTTSTANRTDPVTTAPATDPDPSFHGLERVTRNRRGRPRSSSIPQPDTPISLTPHANRDDPGSPTYGGVALKPRVRHCDSELRLQHGQLNRGRPVPTGLIKSRILQSRRVAPFPARGLGLKQDFQYSGAMEQNEHLNLAFAFRTLVVLQM